MQKALVHPAECLLVHSLVSPCLRSFHYGAQNDENYCIYLTSTTDNGILPGLSFTVLCTAVGEA